MPSGCAAFSSANTAATSSAFLSAISGLVLYLIKVRFIAFSSVTAAEAAHLDPKDVWGRPKDAVPANIFSSASFPSSGSSLRTEAPSGAEMENGNAGNYQRKRQKLGARYHLAGLLHGRVRHPGADISPCHHPRRIRCSDGNAAMDGKRFQSQFCGAAVD